MTKYPYLIEIVPGPSGYGISPINSCMAGYCLYQCPGCGRTEKEALIGTYSINKTCTCNFPTCVYIMNYIGSWKHPSWIEFDERSYWEDWGLITLTEGERECLETLEENLWLQKTPIALNVKVTTEEKSMSWISQIKTLWKEKLRSLPS